MLDDVSDSFLLQASAGISDSLHSGINIADLILDDTPTKNIVIAPNVLSQLAEEEFPVVAGQIETTDGKVLPITIGQTDIGNGNPTPYIHISDDATVLSRHITITTVQTNDGKFRALLRVNHAHGAVQLGGSVIRPETMYPIMDDDEIILGDGVRFRLRLNNQSPPGRGRQSLGAPTPHYIPAPNSEELHETEEKEKEEKRRHFQERLTPPNDDALLLQLAAASDPTFVESRDISLVHQMGDTCPYSSGRESTSQHIASKPKEEIPTLDEILNAAQAEEFISEAGDNIMHSSSTPVQEADVGEDEEEPMSEGTQPPGDEESIDTRSHPEDQTELPVDESVVRPSPPEDQTGAPVDESIDTPSPHAGDEGIETPPPHERQYESSSPENVVPNIPKAAPQLSQESVGERADLSLMERLRSKRGIAREDEDSGSQVSKKRSKKISSIASPPRMSLSGGPKKLVILKTAVEIDKATESAVSSVGAKIDSKWTDKVDALVTGSIVRTTKFMCAINKGLAIFPKAILADIKAYRALPPTDQPELWLLDPEGEKKYGFVLKESILKARTKPLLTGYDVYCFKNSIGEFTSDELRDLITTAGGKLLSRVPKSVPSDGSVILIGGDANASAARSAGANFLNRIEFLVDACIKQVVDFHFARIDL